MSSYPAFSTLEGETLNLNVCATIDTKDAVALLYFCGGDEKACVVQPCSLALSQYQLHIGPLGREECVQLPYTAIATWGIARASTAVTKAFVQVQQAEEAARNAAAAASAHGAAGLNAASPPLAGLTADGAAAAASGVPPLLTPPRPRYADPSPSLFVVTLQTKHVWQHRLVVQSERLLKNLKAHLAMAHCLAKVTDLPAFPYAEERARRQQQQQQQHPDGRGPAGLHSVEFGWNLYSPHREFTRQLCVDASRPAPTVPTEARMLEGRIGVQRDLRPWFGLVDLRDEERGRDGDGRSVDFYYTSSPTYPDLFLQPKLVDRELLVKAMAARSRARVPAISYVCLRTGAVLARSSQPLMRSAQLGADSDVCYSLINMGYAPHHTHPRQTAAVSRSPLATPDPVVAPAPPTAATAATAAAARPARPPSLFDDDDDGDDGGGAAAAAVALPPARRAVCGSPLAAPPSRPPRASSQSPSASPPEHTTTTTTGSTTNGNTHGSPNGNNNLHSAAARVLLVADCRPQITAAANAQLGGGYESGSFYGFCNTNFFEIDNIFGVVNAFEKLRSIVARYQGNTAEKTFLRRLYDADWLAITQRVLVCSVTAAQSLQAGVSCLVHCTDGWDRTSQCTALTMLMLDPYYRTIVGFCTLIEKEFCSFGHKFAERSGHQLPGRTSFFTHSGVASSDTETQQQQHGSAPRLDASPIFLHFLDAVFQIHRQYPSCFEFTTDLLAYLSEAVYSCLYGTFLCNGEQERRLEGVRLRTASVWTDVVRQAQREKAGAAPLRFVNVNYDAATAWKFIHQRRRGSSASPASSSSQRSSAALADFVLLPNCSSKRLVFWEALYLREDADRYLSYNPHVRTPARQQVVSWGADFDAFLDGEVAAACADRAAELASLHALERFMEKEKANAAVASLAAGGARSQWCVYDASNCFSCYKPFGMWSTKTQCPACKQYFCTNCQVHDCMLQQY